ncbi:unnamed protein product, partial [Pylaiella littoralis]
PPCRASSSAAGCLETWRKVAVLLLSLLLLLAKYQFTSHGQRSRIWGNWCRSSLPHTHPDSASPQLPRSREQSGSGLFRADLARCDRQGWMRGLAPVPGFIG